VTYKPLHQCIVHRIHTVTIRIVRKVCHKEMTAETNANDKQRVDVHLTLFVVRILMILVPLMNGVRTFMKILLLTA
jgi:hypothetical protein